MEDSHSHHIQSSQKASFKNQLIPDHQFGFRQRHSTIEQTQRIAQRINEALERKQYCSAAILDITQAFDKVWHTGLLYKLKLSLTLNYLLILNSYLQNRQFLVKIENKYTELSPVNAGVPQSSVLGPLLYSLHTYQSHQKLHEQPLQTTQQ
jgi:retron-type reverse transcriptase